MTDFLADEDFKSWVIQPDDQRLTTKWEQVRSEHRHLSILMDQARETIINLRMQKFVIDPEQQKDDWETILNKITLAPAPVVRKVSPLKRFSFLWKTAAMLIAALVIGYYFIPRTTTMVEVSTAYGQERKITLPDNSTILLYPHSTIRYAAIWKPGKSREVWINGEAHLNVTKTRHLSSDASKHIPFQVYLKDSLSVTVIGTEFSVFSRKNHPVSVQLQSGLVQINIPNETVRLLPGESITYLDDSGLVKHTEPLAITRIPQTNELALRNARVDETIQYIEANFGVMVHSQPSFRTRYLDGIIPFTTAEETLMVLAAILDGELVTSSSNTFNLSEKQ
ncbi:MAG: FecR family protein [Sphingobacterium sp.]